MKSVLISIRPEWCEKIVNGKKTIEVRKSAPKEVPFKAYIYCSKEKKQDDIIWAGAFGDRGKWNGHVIGEFICDKVSMEFVGYRNHEPCYWYLLDGSCLTKDELMNYGEWATLYGWHISNLKIYDKPKELSEFKTGCKGCKERDTYHCKFYCYGERPLTRPPQSWQYVDEVEE